MPIIIKFCIPILLGALFQQFYNATDAIIIGRFLGANALAAVGTTSALAFLILGFVMGLCNGFGVHISQRFGAGDEREMRRFAGNAIYLGAVFAIVLTSVTIIFARPLLRLIEVPEDIIDLSYSYMIFIFAGIPFTMSYNFLTCLLRAMGDSKSALYFLAIASVVNIGLDLLFIVVFDMGVGGAGLATVISQVVAVLFCFTYIRRNYPILRLTKEDMKYSLNHCKKLFSTGVPMGLEFSIVAIGALILQRAVNGLGTLYIASITTGNRISLMLYQPLEAVGLAMATFCGQNLGAKKLARIKSGIRSAMFVQLCYSVFIGVVAWTLGKYFAQAFVGSDEPEIIANVQFQLRVAGSSYMLIGILFVLRNSLQGLGYSFMAMAGGSAELVGRILVALILVPRFGFYGAVFAGALAWLLSDSVLIPCYFVAMRKLRKTLFKPSDNGSKAVETM
ncbi:MAG: MATE family efflux transporter [Oscillospiraceae bacterium]|nr:MATE family efflux transporter [Oscillospiraceae bacterium]